MSTPPRTRPSRSPSQSSSFGVGNNETLPLVSSRFPSSQSTDNDRSETVRRYRRERSQSEISLASIKETIVKFSKRRFWWFCGFGIIAIIVLQLSFLPRTSLSRDYRRWHNLHLTKNDIKRNYLVYSGDNGFQSGTNEQYIEWTIKNITELNKPHNVNLISDDNNDIVSYIADKFRDSKLKTVIEEFPSNLSAPINTNIELSDKAGIVYEADVVEDNTPGYYGYGKNASIEGDFMYVNQGLEEDYELLIKKGFVVKDKLVIMNSSPYDNKTIIEKTLIAENYGVKGLIHYTNITNTKAIIRDTLVYNYGNPQTPKIPVIPIDIKTISPILGTLGPDTHWNYYPENPKFKLKLSTKVSGTDRHGTNIIGSIDGIIKDGDIIIGASRDSFTSSNPLSNHVILLEILRHYSKLIQLGWKPLRNLKFISFDQSKNGFLGSQKFLETYNRNIVTFINLDDDIITGEKFRVSANPLLNHILRKVTKSIPMPEKYVKDSDEDNDDDDDDGATLYKYWKFQDNHEIDNQLGKSVINQDSLIFQYHKNTPIISIKFTNDSESGYIPNSNYYSYKWIKQVDPNFDFHNTLIKYIGLLIISLSEHEVIDFKTTDYCQTVITKFNEYLDEYSDQMNQWELNPVETFGNFTNFIDNFKKLNKDLTKSSITFDEYNMEVQEGLIEDYPWFQAFKKLKIWAQFKVTNYKLLNLDKYLKKENDWNSHLIYNIPKLNAPGDSILYDVSEATKEGDYTGAIKHLNLVYTVFESLNRKMSLLT